jgi:hypothetical protein
MKIRFYLDDLLYQGEATAVQKPSETQFLVKLDGVEPFHICMSDEGNWHSDDAGNEDLARAAGQQIAHMDEAGSNDALEPERFYSMKYTDGQAPVYSDGEITNEPEDVQEQSV